MLRSIPLLALLAAILFAASALADGKIVPRSVAVPPPIPDQQAIIAWDGPATTETLAIETRFAAVHQSPPSSGSAEVGDSPYAWIVPLPGPAAPEISAATPGLFSTVRAIFQPRVYDNGPDLFGPVLFLTAMLLLGVWVGMRGKGSRLSSLVSILLVLLGFTCIGGLLLPTLGTARSAAPDAALGVSVLSRSVVGSYEIAVVGADAAASGLASDKALAAWFKVNGFDLPAAADPVLADYAARSWVFAAVKLRPDAAAGGAAYLAPHPLIFKFKAAAPVYPMRLTGIGNGPLALDLYIFGQARASAPGLAEVRCDRCEFGEDVEGSSRRRRAGVIGIGHPALKSIVGVLPVATKLSGTLPPAMQMADMSISWSAFERSGAEMQSPRSARWRGIEAGFAVVPAVIVVLIVIGAIRGLEGRFVFRNLAWALAPAIAISAAKWMATPTVGVIEGGARAAGRTQREFDELPDLVGTALRSANREPTIDEVRVAARAIAEEHGLKIVEEDAPYGFAIRAGDETGSIAMVLRNWCGAPETRRVWPTVSDRK